MPEKLIHQLLSEAEDLGIYIEVEAEDSEEAKVIIPGPPRQILTILRGERLEDHVKQD